MGSSSVHIPKEVLLIAVAVVVLGLFAFRMNRMRQMRPLKLEWLWITPALMAGMVGFMLWGMGQQGQHLAGMDWLWVSVAALVGAVIGWYRGRLMKIEVDPETHALNQQASPIAIIFLIALFAIRRGVDYAMQTEAKSWHISVILLTAAPVFLVVGMLAMTRVEMFIRARRLLDEARRGGAVAA
jgi:hypothetical protein